MCRCPLCGIRFSDMRRTDLLSLWTEWLENERTLGQGRDRLIWVTSRLLAAIRSQKDLPDSSCPIESVPFDSRSCLDDLLRNLATSTHGALL